MSGVVLRCPGCGTTQSHAGECEACYEGEVRYFCGNHTPGRWLDQPACGQCGAKFGDPPKKAPVPPGGGRGGQGGRGVGGGSASRPSAGETRGPKPRPPVSRGVEPPRMGSRRTPPRPRDPIAAPPRLTLEHILERMSSAERERAGFPGKETPAPELPELRLPSLPIKGCIFRFVMFVLLLIALAVGGLFMLVGGGVQGFVVDVAQSTGLMTGTPEQTRRGIDAFRRGDFATAEQELTQASMTYPRSALALLYLARMRTDAGDLLRAGEYLETAVAREPSSPPARRELGLNYLYRAQASGRLPTGELKSRTDLMEADRHLLNAVSLDPRDRAAVGYRGCALAELGAVDEANSFLAAAGEGPWHQCAGNRSILVPLR